MPGTQQTCFLATAVLACAHFPLGRLFQQGPFPGLPEWERSPRREQSSRGPGSWGGTVPGTPRAESRASWGGRRSVTRASGPERGAPSSQPISGGRRTMGPRQAEPGPPWVRFPAPHRPRRRSASRATQPGPVARSDTPAPLGGARATPGSGTQAAPGRTLPWPPPAGFPRLPRAGRAGGRAGAESATISGGARLCWDRGGPARTQ